MLKLFLISASGLLFAPLLWGRVIYGEDQRVEVGCSAPIAEGRRIRDIVRDGRQFRRIGI